MTREEAIEKLELMRQKVDEETYRALILAIKALEQNESAEKWYKLFVEKLDEQEPCTDAVSREDALKVASKECQEFRGIYGRIEEGIQNLPSVTQNTQKSGKWIVHPKGIYAHLVCNRCLSNAPYNYESNYCPNCGAKMESEEQK